MTTAKKTNFTLIELLIIISIMGILASILLPSLNDAKDSAEKVVCSSNLRQAGVAIMAYAKDHDRTLATNVFVNTLASKYLWKDNNQFQGPFHGGKSGYVEPYLSDSDAAYNCPGSEHPNDFGDAPLFTSRQGVYAGFTDWRYTYRKIEKNTICFPVVDDFMGWSDFSMTPLLMDPVFDMTTWGGNWSNSQSVIHNNTGSIPILILDGRVHQFNRSKHPTFWPIFFNQYDPIIDDLLEQIN